MHKSIEIITIHVKGQIKSNSNIVNILLNSIKGNDDDNNNIITIKNKDIIVFAQKIISKSEGRLINLNKVKPSQKCN